MLTMDNVLSLYHKKIQATPEKTLEACTGFIEEHQIYLIRVIKSNIKQTKSLIKELENRVMAILSKYENAMTTLKEIPGIDRKVDEDLITEIGLDMGKFTSEKHLNSWADM